MADAFVSAYEPCTAGARWPMALRSCSLAPTTFPFPIPLKKNGGGQWFFDTAAGKDEILARRVGRNELAVIDVCFAMADAQAEYFSQSAMVAARNNMR